MDLSQLGTMSIDQLKAAYNELLVELRDLHLDNNGDVRTELTSAEEQEYSRTRNQLDRVEGHLKIREAFEGGGAGSVEQAFGAAYLRGGNPFEGINTADALRMGDAEARDRALRALEVRGRSLKPDQLDQVDAMLRATIAEDNPNLDGAYIAKRTMITESPAYRTAWKQLVTDPHPLLKPEEVEAVRAYRELERTESRAMSEGSSPGGGYGVPVFIDPSIVMTAQGSGNPFMQICRVEPITTNAWKGVSSAGMTWSFDTEASTVSDDSPTLAQPSVTVFMARGFIPWSIEVGQDYPSFAEEMAALLAEGYDELLVDKFSRGSGTNEPKGILTALDANTNVEVLLTTAGSFGEVDLYAVWKAVPQRFRRKAAWMMNIGVNNSLRRFGTANVFHAYTDGLPQAFADVLFGKAVYESPYFSDFTATTAHQNVLVVGDWSNYLIARRAGMAIELVPQIFDTSTGRPTGQRGHFAWGRIGGNSINDLGLRLLNQT